MVDETPRETEAPQPLPEPPAPPPPPDAEAQLGQLLQKIVAQVNGLTMQVHAMSRTVAGLCVMTRSGVPDPPKGMEITVNYGPPIMFKFGDLKKPRLIVAGAGDVPKLDGKA